LITIPLGFVIIDLNQSSERNMINTPYVVVGKIREETQKDPKMQKIAKRIAKAD
jgi:hypothetical protein